MGGLRVDSRHSPPWAQHGYASSLPLSWDFPYRLLLRLTFSVCNTDSCRLLARLQIIGCSDSPLACVRDYLG